MSADVTPAAVTAYLWQGDVADGERPGEIGDLSRDVIEDAPGGPAWDLVRKTDHVAELRAWAARHSPA